MKLKLIRDDTQGSILVEAAVTMPLFILLTFGITQAGLLFWVWAGLQHGVEMAARCASVSDAAIAAGLDPATTPTPCYNTNGNITANATSVKKYAARNSLWFYNNPASGSTYFNVPNPQPSCGNQVTASYPFSLIPYVFSRASVPLPAQSCYPTTSG
jgi:Flp pilus assembly protein TadG